MALTELLASIVKLQGDVVQLDAEPVPELKPANSEPALAVAMTSTAVPLGWGLVQAPAEPPLNLHLIVPVPVPASLIVRVRGIRLKVAVTALLASSVKLQGDVVQLDAEPVPELKPAIRSGVGGGYDFDRGAVGLGACAGPDRATVEFAFDFA